MLIKKPKLCKFRIQLVQVACGGDHSLLLTRTCQVLSMGSNDYGQLGISTRNTTPKVEPILINFKGRDGGELKESILSIHAGDFNSFIISKKGSVYSWGMGREGQLGQGCYEDCYSPTKIDIPNSPNRRRSIIEKVKAGLYHTILISRGGHVFGSGLNTSGLLGLGTLK